MQTKPTATPEQAVAISKLLSKSITFGEKTEKTDQEIMDYVQGKLDRMQKYRLPSKEVGTTLRFITRKKKPKHISWHHYDYLINQVLTKNGYAN